MANIRWARMTDRRIERGEVGAVARALGFAGLLPQMAAVWLAMTGDFYGAGKPLAYAYGALIFSFLGGMWWGFAMRRGSGQGALVAVSVLPSLAALALALADAWSGTLNRSLVLLGIAIVLTLVVDYRLFRTGEAPAGWMALRVPLSIGLGGLTILAGLV